MNDRIGARLRRRLQQPESSGSSSAVSHATRGNPHQGADPQPAGGGVQESRNPGSTGTSTDTRPQTKTTSSKPEGLPAERCVRKDESLLSPARRRRRRRD
ncbi:unnamed protein product [Merluccius merluccius]